MKSEGTVNSQRKHYITLCGELALEEAMDLSQERLWNECVSTTVVLGFQVFCDVTLCQWVGGF